MEPYIKEKILVVSICGEKNYFFAVQNDDKTNKVIFFDRFDYGEILWSVTKKPTVISLFRNGEEFDKATPYVSGEKESRVELRGFNKLRESLNTSQNRDWPNHMKDKELRAQSFKSGDIIYIDKEWQPFEHQDKWVSEIAEFKGYHGQFFNLFKKIDCPDCVKKFLDFDIDDLHLDRLIFISPSCVDELKKYYQ